MTDQTEPKLDPYAAFDECALAVETLEKFLAEARRRPVMTALLVYYCHFSHRAGGSRNLVLHAISPAVAERMAWAGHHGSRHNWSVTLIEATSFENLEVC